MKASGLLRISSFSPAAFFQAAQCTTEKGADVGAPVSLIATIQSLPSLGGGPPFHTANDPGIMSSRLRIVMIVSWLTRRCPSCGSLRLTRSSRRGVLERIISIVVLPYRCAEHDHRFLKFRGLIEVQNPWLQAMAALKADQLATAQLPHQSEGPPLGQKDSGSKPELCRVPKGTERRLSTVA